MRRALPLAVAALLAVAPAASSRTLVISNYSRSLSADIGQAPVEYLVPAVLREYGATFDVLPWTHPGIDTATMRTGLINGIQYDVIVHAGWHAQGVPSSFAAKRANYLTINSRWPLIPHVFVSSTAYADAGQWNDGAFDSTGNASIAPNSNFQRYREYDAATGAGWFIKSGNFVDLDETLNPKNVWRKVLKIGASRVQHALGAGAPVQFREVIEAPAIASAVDSCRLLVKYATSDYSPTWRAQAPCVFVTGPGYEGDVFPLIAALTIADSASGGKVFDNAAKLPQRASIVIGPWFSTGNHRNTTYKSGMFCAADSCDTANVHTTIDSLIALGIRGTVGVQVDSIGALSWQKPYLMKLLNTGRWKVSLQEWTGIAVGSASGDARTWLPRRIIDPLGVSRARTLIPPNATSLPLTCAASDSSIYCLVKSAIAALDSVFPGKVDRTLTAPGGKDTYGWARSITRANGRTLDSLMWVLYHAGVRAIEVDPLDYGPLHGAGPFGNPLQTGGYFTVWDSAGAMTGGGARFRRPIYQMPIIPIRGYEVNGASWGMIPGHAIGEEFQWGRFNHPWYDVEGAGPFWNHNFQTRTLSYRVATSSLGGAGQGTTPNRPAYWQIRKFALQTQLITRLSIPGKQIWLWDWPENVATMGDLR
jgi:hypothetical protein